MEYRYRDGEEIRVVRLIERGETVEVEIEGRRYQVATRTLDPTTLALWIDGHYQQARLAAQGNEQWVALDDDTFHVTRVRHRRSQRGGGEGQDTLTATMPGQIVSILVAPGERVERGQTLLLMEAMKMELRVTAPHDGTVSTILVSEGEAVERGQTLAEMA